MNLDDAEFSSGVEVKRVGEAEIAQRVKRAAAADIPSGKRRDHIHTAQKPRHDGPKM